MIDSQTRRKFDVNKKEISILLVKPDGVAEGLVDEIREIILSTGLTIIEEVGKIISRESAEQLYGEIDDVRHCDYFLPLIEFMTSNLVHIFIVQGEDAVRRVRVIIGKNIPPSGIRKRWAESLMHNVAHGPHTYERAREEILILIGKEINVDENITAHLGT